MRRPRPNLGCCATKNINEFKKITMTMMMMMMMVMRATTTTTTTTAI
jgi:hypothetical protein